MSCLLGYAVGQATATNNTAREIPEVNIQVEKCKALPTKAETLVCLNKYEESQVITGKELSIIGGAILATLLVIVLFANWLARI